MFTGSGECHLRNKEKSMKLRYSLLVVMMFVFCIVNANAQRQMEKLDRGLVAFAQNNGQVYLGWRLLKADSDGVVFNVYRSTDDKAMKLNDQPIATSTNFVDRDVSTEGSHQWWVVPVVDGKELEASKHVGAMKRESETAYVSIPLQGDYSFQKIGIADLNGDGALDYVVKQPGRGTDPGEGHWRPSPGTYKIEAYLHDGTFLWSKDLGWNIEQGIWWSPMVVYDFDGDGKAEIALKTAPTDVDYRKGEGRVLDGPEYCSVWNGMTGEEIARVDWIARGNVSDWGDSAGNRASRHQIGMAYLDGKRPSLLVIRGTYTTMKIDAYNLVDGKLEPLWKWNGDDENPQVRGQGLHGIHAVDVDGDGRDEILNGSSVVDEYGKILWCNQMGHPDMAYVTDIIPERPGLEVAYGYESKQEINGISVFDVKTGELIWGHPHPTTHIHDQGMFGDFVPDNPGLEFYSAEQNRTGYWLYAAATGKLLDTENLGGLSPRALYWGDGLIKAYMPGRIRGARPQNQSAAQLAEQRQRPRQPRRNSDQTSKIIQYKGEQLGEIQGRVIGIADCFGDWREEIIVSVEGELRIYSTTIPATRRNVCLMQDPLYRQDAALQAMGYIYPPQLSYFVK
ncbi:MAG: rhamnogalacturonan endolyase [Candidatus Latescibacterota bacterium]|jgi:rhamnogalacturonan endolyase